MDGNSGKCVQERAERSTRVKTREKKREGETKWNIIERQHGDSETNGAIKQWSMAACVRHQTGEKK